MYVISLQRQKHTPGGNQRSLTPLLLPEHSSGTVCPYVFPGCPNDGTWKKVHEYTDKGNWGSTMNRCGGAPDQLITWGSPVATFRWDKTANVDFNDLSIREIEPPSS
jgi:hypothetical protein